MVRIGSAQIDTNIFLAPLAGCADLAFRLIAREHGCRFCFFEMLDAHIFSHNRRTALDVLKTTPADRPIAAQLLGSEPSVMLGAAERLLKTVDIAFLDINCACPVKKVVRKGAGAKLLQNPKLLAEIVKTLAGALDDVPVTVKMRLGMNRKEAEPVSELAKRCEDSGAACLFIHGRTADAGHSGEIDYAAIRSAKDAVKIPVFGAGNILTPELAKRMFDETGCDGITVARGALGNPWIFKAVEGYMTTGKLPAAVTVETKKEILKRHLGYIEKYREMRPSSKAGFMRKAALWYARGFPQAAAARALFSRAKSYAAMRELIDAL